MARVELGELDLALGALAVRGRRRGPLLRHRPLPQRGRCHGLRLQQVDATQQPAEQAGGVAADLVAAQRQIVETVEQHGQAVGRADGGEERIEPGLGRVLAQERLGRLLVGVDPELLVGAIQQQLGPLAQPGAGGA